MKKGIKGRPPKSISPATLKKWESIYGENPVPLPIIAMHLYGADDSGSVNKAYRVLKRKKLTGVTYLYDYENRDAQKVFHYSIKDLKKAYA